MSKQGDDNDSFKSLKNKYLNMLFVQKGKSKQISVSGA